MPIAVAIATSLAASVAWLAPSAGAYPRLIDPQVDHCPVLWCCSDRLPPGTQARIRGQWLEPVREAEGLHKASSRLFGCGDMVHITEVMDRKKRIQSTSLEKSSEEAKRKQRKKFCLIFSQKYAMRSVNSKRGNCQKSSFCWRS